MYSIKEVGWIAGIIEGEGNFSFVNGPAIHIGMTDEDTIVKISKLFKRPYYSIIKKDRKILYKVSICGTPAIEWIFTIYSLMSYRRKSQMLDVINKWRSMKTNSMSINFSCGHPRDSNTDLAGGCRICRRKRSLAYYHRNKANG